MEKILPSSFKSVKLLLLLFVAFLATGNLVAQEPGNCNIMSTIPARGCAGAVNIYSAAMNPASNGQHLVWSFTVNQTGAFFTNANGDNLGNTVTTVCHSTVIDEPNNVLINVGPNAGSLTVQMFIQEQGTVGGCNSSRTVRKVAVALEPGKVTCHDELGCVQATATTQFSAGGAFVPSPPYLYTLVETGATSTDGAFCGLTPGVVYHVAAREVVVGDLNTCNATSDGKSIINPPATPVHAACPLPKIVNSCDYVTQQELNDAYDLWYQGFQYSGGTQPITVVRTGQTDYPLLCGGVGRGSIDVTDFCKNHDFCTSTFTVTPPTAVVPDLPGNLDVKACDIIDRDNLLARIAAYKLLFKVVPGGGCAPKVTFDDVVVPTEFCAGDITISGHITDRCDVDIPFSRLLHIIPVVPVQYSKPADDIKPACYYKDSTELVNAYGAWFRQFIVVPGTGCDPQIKLEQEAIPDICGGYSRVTATITDKCFETKVISGVFGVDPPGDWVIKNCPIDVKLGCNPKEEDFPGVITLTTDSQCPTTQDVKDVVTHIDCLYTLTRTYTVKTTCDLVGKTCVQKITYKIDTEAPIIIGLKDKEVPGSGSEDPNLCTPTTTVGGVAKDLKDDGGTANVTIDFSQPRTGDAPAETLTWTNGTTTAQSEYVEGMGVPQRLLLAGLKGTKHTLRFRHEAVKKQSDSRHAYDFLMSWEQAVKTGENIGNNGRSELKNLLAQECDLKWSGAGQAQCNGMTTSAKADIPDVIGNPPNQTGNRNVNDNITCFEQIYGNRQIEIEGTAAISNVVLKFEGYTGDASKDNFAWYSLSWESASPAVLVKWAGRLAPGGGSCGYGNCHGAGSINGNPYHMILGGVDGKGAGSRDNQTKCKRPTVCVVDIPVQFDTPTATDCPDKVVVPVKDGGVVSTTNPDGSITRCQSWIATDECGNIGRAKQCITIVCPPGSPNLEEVIINTGKTTGYNYLPVDNTIDATVATPAISRFAAYPNPFTNSYSLSLDTSSTERVHLNVYDMLGKQLDQRVTTPGEITTLNLGSTYPTGNYILRLEQATEVRTLRLLKQ